jgi:hypothetical protein
MQQIAELIGISNHRQTDLAGYGQLLLVRLTGAINCIVIVRNRLIRIIIQFGLGEQCY